MRPLEKKCSNAKSSGFTLIELSIVIGISAFLLIAFMRLLSAYQVQLQHEQAKRAVANAKTNLAQFYNLEGRYPCPARGDLLPTDANYGAEDCSSGLVNGARDTNNANGRTDDQVIVGVFPTYAIVPTTAGNSTGRLYLNQLTEANEIVKTNTIDPWGNKLTYAVTALLTKKYDVANRTTTFDSYRGAIQIVDELGRDTGGTAQNAHFVVVSHGEDGVGGINAQTGFTKPCDAAYTLEAQNCNGQAVFASALRSNSEQAANKNIFFDDYVGFDVTLPTALWSQNDVGGIKQMQTVNVNKVGIKTETPRAALEIGKHEEPISNKNTLKVDRVTYAQKICDSSSPECITPKSLIDLKCGASGTTKYINKVRVNTLSGSLEAECEHLSFKRPVTGCADGEYLSGIRTDGTYECSIRHPGYVPP